MVGLTAGSPSRNHDEPLDIPYDWLSSPLMVDMKINQHDEPLSFMVNHQLGVLDDLGGANWLEKPPATNGNQP